LFGERSDWRGAVHRKLPERTISHVVIRNQYVKFTRSVEDRGLKARATAAGDPGRHKQKDLHGDHGETEGTEGITAVMSDERRVARWEKIAEGRRPLATADRLRSGCWEASGSSESGKPSQSETRRVGPPTRQLRRAGSNLKRKWRKEGHDAKGSMRALCFPKFREGQATPSPNCAVNYWGGMISRYAAAERSTTGRGRALALIGNSGTSRADAACGAPGCCRWVVPGPATLGDLRLF